MNTPWSWTEVVLATAEADAEGTATDEDAEADIALRLASLGRVRCVAEYVVEGRERADGVEPAYLYTPEAVQLHARHAVPGRTK